MDYANTLVGFRHAFLTRKETAAHLGYKDTRSIDRLISSGELKAIKLDTGSVRIYGKELEKFLARRCK
ncbi:MAG: hypothetical protein CML86_03680 [Rhodobiaceae bacterium]|nr:hypothetical protein [Rhodobiaceae bacterium]